MHASVASLLPARVGQIEREVEKAATMLRENERLKQEVALGKAMHKSELKFMKQTLKKMGANERKAVEKYR